MLISLWIYPEEVLITCLRASEVDTQHTREGRGGGYLPLTEDTTCTQAEGWTRVMSGSRLRWQRELVHGVEWEKRENSRGEGETMLEKSVGNGLWEEESETFLGMEDLSEDPTCWSKHQWCWRGAVVADQGCARLGEERWDPWSLGWGGSLPSRADLSWRGQCFFSLYGHQPCPAEVPPGACGTLSFMPYHLRKEEMLPALLLWGEDAAPRAAACLCLGVNQWWNQSPLPSGKTDETLKKLQTLMAVLRPPHPAQMFWETLAELWGTPICVPGKHGSREFALPGSELLLAQNQDAVA